MGEQPGSLEEKSERSKALLTEGNFDLALFGDEALAESILSDSQSTPLLNWIKPEVAKAFSSRSAFAEWAMGNGPLLTHGTRSRMQLYLTGRGMDQGSGAFAH